jgi:hypothetical protein
MPAPSESDLRLEIGHVLLIDIVGYSKLLITEQRERLETLNEIVRNSEQFRVSDANGMLVRIPTGDRPFGPFLTKGQNAGPKPTNF